MIAWAISGHVMAQAPQLDEAEAVRRALSRATLIDMIEAEVAVEDGRRRAASAYPNPQLNYLREQTSGAMGTGEDYLSIAQSIDLGNRRGIVSDAGRARIQAAEAQGRATRLSVATTTRQRFFYLLYSQERSTALQQWMTRIDEALAIVTRREQGGDAAMYDRRRLERERAVAMSRTEVELATLDRARVRLATLLEAGASSPVATGTLLPASDPPDLPALRDLVAGLPSLRVLELQADAAAQEGKAAGRWWLPDLRLEAGWKGVQLSGQGRTDGFLFGVSLPVPLWDQSSGLARIAEAQARAAQARRTLLERELGGELAGARAEAMRLRRAASEFAERANATSAELVRVASAGYEGGELGLLELLDAYRGAADDALAALEIAQAARKARIELDHMTGSYP